MTNKYKNYVVMRGFQENRFAKYFLKSDFIFQFIIQMNT